MLQEQDHHILLMNIINNKKDKNMKKVWQFIKFALVGVSNTLISELIYAIIVLCGGHYIVATCIGFFVSVLNAFYWNNRYVFKEDKENKHRVWWKTLLKTYVAYIGGFLLNLILLVFWIEIVNMADYMVAIRDYIIQLGFAKIDCQMIANLLAETINLFIVLPLNFIINKHWAFK